MHNQFESPTNGKQTRRSIYFVVFQFRRYRQRLADHKTPYPIVPGLTDARRAELQNVIADHRQKYPVCRGLSLRDTVSSYG